MSLNWVIANATVITEQAKVVADVGIEGEHVAVIAQPGRLAQLGDGVLDGTGMLLLPGIIDIHFHARTPAYQERGNFYTETRAAAAGGVTTLFEMPISKPGCATRETFLNRRKYVEQQAIIDVALFGAPGTLKPEDVFGMNDEGAIAYKIFMHGAPHGREDEFIGICLIDNESIYEALKLTQRTSKRLVVHCEDDPMLEAGIAQMKAQGRNDAAAHSASRPPVVEAVAVARLLALAEDVGAPVHIAHVSCAQAVGLIRSAQRRGVDVTAETCPHYLFFDESAYVYAGPFAKINPPLRSSADRAALWAALHDGTLKVVTTDHAPYLLEEKLRGEAEIWRAPAGCPGVQTMLPMMMTAVHNGQCSVNDVVKWMSAEPARLFGLREKGAIEVGRDADLVLYDPRAENVFTREQMLSKAADTDRLYLNQKMQGQVAATIYRGRVIYRDGQVLAREGGGRFLRV
jgi:dihydropyrimidinase/allantoinase